MTIDEKLQHFYEVSLEEAREDAAQAIQEHKKLLSEKLEEHRQLSRQNAEAEVKAETEHVRREVNKALSAEQITLKRDWSKKQEELKEALFGEVSTKIRDFMSTSEYETYLCRKIKEAQDLPKMMRFIFSFPALTENVWMRLLRRPAFHFRSPEKISSAVSVQRSRTKIS